MSKMDYFKELNHRLRGLPEKERQNILSVYEELFQKAIENGKQEDDVAQSLGYPRIPNWDASKETPKETPRAQQEPVKSPIHVNIEKSYANPEPSRTSAPTQARPDYPPFVPNNHPNPHMHANPYPYPVKQESGIKAIIVSIALGFFNLIFIVGPWFAVFATLISLFVSGFGLLIAPIIGILGNLLGGTGGDLQFTGFVLLACFGLGIILTTLSTWLIKVFFKLSRMYIQFNAKLIKGA
ncbi:DUF1700 domain-containing protein [Paenibacillus sp. N3.4]|uniref:DUF1700 domain-containing protein n=1 Tax=Paenibacillus sp. N3.4 TaxID=2603222 RepID=UPI0011C835A3|nr:DUF1700 domain-containing protein [Paenibacillus sp. N3.4]TXK80930.1 DUF1700 domain-containing protein [Paenibacillus sp. N3.4]